MPNPQQENKETSSIRLNRYLANSGVCTRREADKLIAKGLVEVDGKVITEMGYQVKKGEKVTYQGELQNAETKQYILINKPKECTIEDVQSRDMRSVYDIIEFACYETLTPTDTLADDTVGLLLMTNDKDLTKKINIKKQEIYHIFLEEEMKEGDLESIRKGIKINGKVINVEAVHFANEEDKKEVGIEIHSAKDETIAELMKHLGYNIKRLDRVIYAGLTKKNVPRGKWRFLTKKEVQFLKMQ